MTEREKVTILIVDDQPAKLLSLETVIAELNENVVTASSAEEALRVLLAQDVAVVLVDVCMPTMDGFELAAMIRGHPRFGRTAIIFISAVHLSDADRLRGYNLGAVDYMPVPIIPEVLRAKVAVFADLHRKTEQLKRLNQELEARVAERTADLAASNARLRNEENRYRSLVANLPAAVFATDAAGYISLYNHAAVELWGREPQIGVDRYTGAYRVLDCDGTPIPVDQTPMAQCLRDGKPVRGIELLHERPDGTVRRVVPYPDPLFDEHGRIVGAINMLMDVTDQRAAETTRSHLAAIVQGSADPIFSKGLSGVIQSWNPAAERVFGYTTEEAIGRSVTTIIPDERHNEETAILDRVKVGERVEHFETVRLAKDGRQVHVSLTVSPVRDGSGRIVGASTIARDISEARAATYERDRLLAVLEATPDLVATTNSAGRVRYMNPAGRRMIGLPEGESAVGMPISQLYAPETARLIEQTAMPAAARDSTWEGETVIRSRQGTQTPVSQVLIAHKGALGDVEVFSTVARDITERKRAEDVLARDRETLERLVAERTRELERSNERLRLTDRMATIGTLSAGLGHDMGNLLLPVRLRLEAIEAASLPAMVRDDVSAIRKATDYLQQLARSLRMLAIDPEREARGETGTDLASWWEESEGMLRNGVQRPTVLSASIPAGLPPLRIGRAALTQIAFNIVQNAGDILRGRDDGRIRIEAQATPARDAVRLSITDNGPGMTEETRRRCMEPFFTTKTRGLSTGLGLSLVGGLVNSAGGSVHIESAPGWGSVFAITLPAAHAAGEDSRNTQPRCAGLAVISLADARMVAHVSSILASMEFQTRRQQPGDASPPPEDADLWITAARDEREIRAVVAFIEARPQRRAVVFTSSAADALNGAGPQALLLDPAIRPSELRTRLRAALSEPAPDAVGGAT
jgi:PAS domain S-box-containing protein